jgi:drug/metabolite transporter (DMT)-like permease
VILLFAAVVLSWGFSWYAITLQVGDVSALVSVAYRFVLAASLMCGWLAFSGRWSLIPLKDQVLVLALGVCMFSLNFVCFYVAAIYLPSGLLSVVFAAASIFGGINASIFLGKPFERKIALAATLGTCGLALLLGKEIEIDSSNHVPFWAIMLPFIGTYLFSIGNIVSAKLTRTYSVFNVAGQGMAWGAASLIVLCFLSGTEFRIPSSSLYWVGLAYLAIIASLLAFLTYLALVRRIGVARTSYATVLFPIVAMFVSTWAEGYEWSLTTNLGLSMTLLGAYLIFRKSPNS